MGKSLYLYRMRLIWIFALFALLGLPMSAHAQEAADGVISVAPDKPQILRLDQDAASVIVGSPKYASVVLDNPSTLLIVPRAAGSTSLTVLNKRGDIIMERRLIIGAAGDKYVRIRRACTGAMPGCQPSSLYYCPDGCHEVGMEGDEKPIPQPGPETVIPMNTPPEIPPIDPAQLESDEQADKQAAQRLETNQQ